MAITGRNPDGTIKSSKLTSEEASKLGKMQKKKEEKLKSADQLLADDGYPDPEEAPERKKLMATEAAKGVVTAIRYFSTKEDITEAGPAAAVQPGQVCPTCKQYVFADLILTEEQCGSVLEMIDEYRG